MSLFGNFESLVWLMRFLVSLGMTEERLSALSPFKWVADLGHFGIGTDNGQRIDILFVHL